LAVDDPIQEGLAHRQAGRLEEASRAFHRALEREPDHVYALQLLGEVYCARGEVSTAAGLLSRAAAIETHDPGLHNNLGALLEELGRLQEAIERYRRAVELDPARAVRRCNLADALLRGGDAEAATEQLRMAATLDPNLAAAWTKLGEALLTQALPRQAIGPLRRASELQPRTAHPARMLGDTLQSLGDLDGAMQAYRRAVAISPELLEAWLGLGHAQLKTERYAEAVESLERCARGAPTQALSRYDLGKALFELGRIEAARPHLQAALELPGSPIAGLALGTLAVILPGSSSSSNVEVLETRKRWAGALPDVPRMAAGRTPGRAGGKLRIGYLSSFFHHRNWMKPVWGLINQHDRDRFEVQLFSDAPRHGIEVGYEEHPNDRFHDVSDLDNLHVAQRVSDAEIDILVDLNGYSRLARMPLYAHEPAPVLVGWFNHYATTGMPCFDFLVGDEQVIPAAEEPCYSERIVRVPGSYLTFRVDYPVPDVVPPPCTGGGGITIGCLASQYKISDEVVATWAAILNRIPGSRLVLRNTGLRLEENRAHLKGRFDAYGIAADRIDALGPTEHYDFLATYSSIDFALDTFPYNGGTTTAEAIWQGVPVITFRGDRWASRTSASILSAAGLDEFIADEKDAYVELAVALGTSEDAPARLAELRSGMRKRLLESPVCDTASFARAMEAFYARAVSEKRNA
jgi:predicted O-linked N-acetylglucosamine transferase (SPINDLY family)